MAARISLQWGRNLIVAEGRYTDADTVDGSYGFNGAAT